MKNGRLVQPINRKELLIMIQQPQTTTQTGQQPAAPAPKEHVVVAGESLEQIARNYGVSTKQLRRLNSGGGPVQPGQKLKIPTPKAAAPAAPAKPAPAPAAPTPTGTTPSATK